ncbi:glycosyltransferase [Eggerthella sp. HF-4214]|uniref:Glycosyltransferase n=2 Tax=Eggerthella guodeyinii TaxID=2690837 RepID=A0A6N7RLX9_9ACTN|nr:glycosyltransferase [Eggerthella guodeyinii]
MAVALFVIRKGRSADMNTPLFDVVLVLYNRPLACAEALPTLLQDECLNRIIVCDNSSSEEIAYGNSIEASSIPSITYVGMGGNKGLSKAYNRALDLLESDYVCMLDHDTKVPPRYLTRISRWTTRRGDVFVPIVRCGDRIISPCNKGRFRFKQVEALDRLREGFSAINSGMVVRSSVFDRYRYDEELFLDMVDHRFMDDMRARSARVVVMDDLALEQDFSRNAHALESEQARYLTFKSDSRRFYSEGLDKKVFCELRLLYRKISLSIKYRTIACLFL